MKKYIRTGKTKDKTPMSKATQSADKLRLLEKLEQAAEEARDRVSGYSDDQRSHLEQCARALIKGVNPQKVCRAGQ